MNSIRKSLCNFSLFKHLTQSHQTVIGVRTLYSPQYLNIDKFIEGRETTHKQYGNMKENFMSRIKQQVESSDTSMVFTEDLKSIIHLSDVQDLDLLITLTKKFHKQNKELRFGTFVFGPVLMRLLYYLQQPDLAFQLIKDEELKGFFDQIKSFFVVMDLLFKNERYEDVIAVNNIINERQVLETKYPRDCITLTCASCYKLNTPESFDCAINLIHSARTVGVDVVNKALCFITYLALNQKKPDIAMELLSSLATRNNVIYNNLKLTTLAHLNRIPEALNLLKCKVEEDFPSQALIRGDIFECSIDAIKAVVLNANDTELTHSFDQLCRSLKESGSISSQTIDDVLMAPINPRPIMPRTGYEGFSNRPQRRPFSGDKNTYPDFRRKEPFTRQAVGAFSNE